jgi:hypothetical protein
VNSVLRTIFEPKKDEEETGGWRKLSNKGVNNMLLFTCVIGKVVPVLQLNTTPWRRIGAMEV